MGLATSLGDAHRVRAVVLLGAAHVRNFAPDRDREPSASCSYLPLQSSRSLLATCTPLVSVSAFRLSIAFTMTAYDNLSESRARQLGFRSESQTHHNRMSWR